MLLLAQFRPDLVLPGFIGGAIVGMACYVVYRVIKFLLTGFGDYMNQDNDRPW